MPAARARPATPAAGHYRGAVQRAGLRTHVLHWLGALQPLHEGPGQDEKHEPVGALAEPERGAPRKRQGVRWHGTCNPRREGCLWSVGDSVPRASRKGLVTVQSGQRVF